MRFNSANFKKIQLFFFEGQEAFRFCQAGVQSQVFGERIFAISRLDFVGRVEIGAGTGRTGTLAGTAVKTGPKIYPTPANGLTKRFNTLMQRNLRNPTDGSAVLFGITGSVQNAGALKQIVMPILKAGIASLNPKSLILFTHKLIDRMTGNANFTDPQPALADIQAKLDEFETLAVDALDGAKTVLKAREIASNELKDMLRILANYVAMIAAGNANVILSSGFGIRAEAEPAPPLTIPESLKAMRSTITGMVLVDWVPVPNALTYRVMMTTSDPNLAQADWISAEITSKSKAEINNLTPGQYYWFKVQAIGSSGKSGYSDPATVMAA